MVIMIILLILCLPLILMLSLFTTTNVVSIAVDVPVNGIEIVTEEMVELDLDKGDSLEIEYRITPTEASKKDVTVSFSPIGDNKLAEFKVEGTKITPTSSGYARVTLETVDGGYRDSFDVAVRSKTVESISSTPLSDTIVVGGSTEINTAYYPVIASNKALSYRVKEGAEFATVTAGGKIYGIGIGEAVIEVTSLDNPEAKSEFTVNVVSSGVIDFVNDTSYLTALENSGEIRSVLNPEADIDTVEVSLYDGDGALISEPPVSVDFNTDTGVLFYQFTDEAFVGVIEVRITVTTADGDTVTKSCYIERVSEIRVAWEKFVDGYEANASGPTRIGILLSPLGADVSYSALIRYTDSTGADRSLQLDTVTVGETYVCDGGYISIRIEKDQTGVDLVITLETVPGVIEFINEFTNSYIALSVTDNHTGEVTSLDEITVTAIPKSS